MEPRLFWIEFWNMFLIARCRKREQCNNRLLLFWIRCFEFRKLYFSILATNLLIFRHRARGEKIRWIPYAEWFLGDGWFHGISNWLKYSAVISWNFCEKCGRSDRSKILGNEWFHGISSAKLQSGDFTEFFWQMCSKMWKNKKFSTKKCFVKLILM